MPDPDLFLELSNRLTSLAREAGASVVRVDGRRHGSASGVVFSADGVVVTAHHTLERDEEVGLGLPSGESATAEVVGRDPTTDLAVLRVDATGLAPAPWGEPEPDGLDVGALVLGVSRPGRGARASLGVVARAADEWRTPAGGRIDRYLETTLDLHVGISGSLVVTAAGKAAGLATAGLLRGAAIVVPPATLRRVVDALLSHGHVRRGYLGVATIPVPLPEALAAAAGAEGALLVTAVEPESPAARGGVLLGDAIVSLGGQAVEALSDLLPLLEEDRIGAAIPLKLVRAGEVRDLLVTVGARAPRSAR
jgi:S1-C subfamily serine protease